MADDVQVQLDGLFYEPSNSEGDVYLGMSDESLKVLHEESQKENLLKGLYVYHKTIKELLQVNRSNIDSLETLCFSDEVQSYINYLGNNTYEILDLNAFNRLSNKERVNVLETNSEFNHAYLNFVTFISTQYNLEFMGLLYTIADIEGNYESEIDDND